ncbi:TolB family protein [Gemmatimonadota bacterium]
MTCTSSLISSVAQAVTRPSCMVAGLLLATGIACTDSLGPDDGAESPPGGIIFVSDRSGAVSGTGAPLCDIYRVNADGTDLENLTNDPAQIYRDLRLSPDGTRIAFESDRVGCFNIWSMDTEGTGPEQLTGQPGERCSQMPRWSGDGFRIGFTTSREPIERSWEAYVMNADGSDPHNVSDDAGLGEGYADWPHAWSPDGRLVFHHQKTDLPETYIVYADGTGREPFLETQAGYAPFWSPDGSKVAFITERDGNQEVYLMNSDGTGVLNLTQNPGDDTFFHGSRANLFVDPWSPDGTLVSFASERDGNQEIYVMHRDGTGLTNVTNNPATDRFAGWSPDGNWIAFESDRTGQWHIYAVNLDRAELWQITSGSANDWNAIWVGG